MRVLLSLISRVCCCASPLCSSGAVSQHNSTDRGCWWCFYAGSCHQLHKTKLHTGSLSSSLQHQYKFSLPSAVPAPISAYCRPSMTLFTAKIQAFIFLKNQYSNYQPIERQGKPDKRCLDLLHPYPKRRNMNTGLHCDRVIRALSVWTTSKDRCRHQGRNCRSGTHLVLIIDRFSSGWIVRVQFWIPPCKSQQHRSLQIHPKLRAHISFWSLEK